MTYHDPEGDALIRRAESVGGAENLSEGEQWRLQGALAARRRREARAAQPSGRTDTLDARANERRFGAIEKQLALAHWMLKEAVPQVLAEHVAEERSSANADLAKRLAELRNETEQKLNAQYAGFESAVSELRNEDRAALLENLRQTLGEAEVRIDTSLANALEAEKERSEIELALVRDELLNVVAEKAYGQPTDDAPKLELAEKAIASLRKRMSSIEEEGARQAARSDQLAGVADQLAALEDAYRKATKSLFIRASANLLAVRKEAKRADDLTDKIATLEATMAKLIGALIDRKVID